MTDYPSKDTLNNQGQAPPLYDGHSNVPVNHSLNQPYNINQTNQQQNFNIPINNNYNNNQNNQQQNSNIPVNSNYNTVNQQQNQNGQNYNNPYLQNNPNVIYVVQPNNPEIIYVQSQKVVNEYPTLSVGLALMILIVNIFLPGIGTIVVGCLNGVPNRCYFIGLGILQLFLAYFIIGYVWAIITSVMLLSNAR